MSDDYYEENGCCLTCEDQEEGCLCYNCKCTKCDWYENEGGEGRCSRNDLNASFPHGERRKTQLTDKEKMKYGYANRRRRAF